MKEIDPEAEPEKWRAGLFASFGSLSERELFVLYFIAVGKKRPDIAEAMGISDNTLGRHITRLRKKLGIRKHVDLTEEVARTIFTWVEINLMETHSAAREFFWPKSIEPDDTEE